MGKASDVGRYSGTWCVSSYLGGQLVPKVFCSLPSIYIHSCECCLIFQTEDHVFFPFPSRPLVPLSFAIWVRSSWLGACVGGCWPYISWLLTISSPCTHRVREKINVTAAFPCIHSAILKGGSQPAVFVAQHVMVPHARSHQQ